MLISVWNYGEFRKICLLYFARSSHIFAETPCSFCQHLRIALRRQFPRIIDSREENFLFGSANGFGTRVKGRRSMRLLISIGAILALAASAAAQDLSCSQRYCKKMSNCQEAVWRFDHCGASQLDRDHDGLPCENVCRTADDVSQARKANAATLPDPSVHGLDTAAGREDDGAGNTSAQTQDGAAGAP
jgi:hypothetical protein